jgi:hypothetical protein
MNRIVQLLLIAALASLGACQKVIDVKLNSTGQRYVIVGSIDDGPGPHSITVSRTKDFSGTNDFDSVSGALVLLTDLTTSATDTLYEAVAGCYRTSTTIGIPGHSYKLFVSIGGQQFSAVSAMPARAVDIDSLYVRKSEFGGDFYFATPVFTDPVGKGQYYKLRQWINDTAIAEYSLRSDEFRDGQTYTNSLFYNSDEDSGNPKIKDGDSIRVELQGIDAQVYDYYRTLRDVTGENSATPANPQSNITGGALGIFNACTSRQKRVKASF